MLVILLALPFILLSYSNGANDVSKGVATLVGSGVTNYRRAILWGAFWTIVGGIVSSFFALELVKTFSLNGIIKPNMNLDHFFPVAVAIAAFIWISFATITRLPVSTTHSITGAICGAGVAAVGFSGVIWSVLGKKIFLPLLISPILALFIAWLLAPMIRAISSKIERYCLCFEVRNEVTFSPVISRSNSIVTLSQILSFPRPSLMAAEKGACRDSLISPYRYELLDLFHWVSSGMTSFARGLNDAPKIVALSLGTSILQNEFSAFECFLFVSVSMGLGSIVSGLRVTETLSERVTPMTPQEGFSANLTTAMLVCLASRFGLPVSTTHVSTGSIIGIGIKHGIHSVKWKVVRDMLLAWFITLPLSALLALLTLWVLKYLI